MEDAADSFTLLAQLVEVGDGRFGLFDVIFDALFLEQGFGVGVSLEDEVHAPGEDHDFDALLQYFGNVGRLGSGAVAGAGLVPVPFPGSAGPDFAIFEGLGTAVYGHFHPAPGDMAYGWRLIVHDSSLAWRLAQMMKSISLGEWPRALS